MTLSNDLIRCPNEKCLRGFTHPFEYEDVSDMVDKNRTLIVKCPGCGSERLRGQYILVVGLIMANLQKEGKDGLL